MRKRLGDRVAKDEVVAVLESGRSPTPRASISPPPCGPSWRRPTTIASRRSGQARLVGAGLPAGQSRPIGSHPARRPRPPEALRPGAERDRGRGRAEAGRGDAETSPPCAGTSSARRSPAASSSARSTYGTKVGGEGDPADVYTVADLSTVWIELSVPTTELAKVREGAPVAVTPARRKAATPRRRQGRLRQFLNPDTRSAGSSSPCRTRTSPGAPAPSSPPRSRSRTTRSRCASRRLPCRRSGASASSRAHGGGLSRSAEVELGRSDDDSYEVVSGLKPGDPIALANSFLLKAELGKSEAGDDD